MKIIDLLNKIANGEEVPEKIKVNRYIYTYAPYIDYINEDNNYLMDIIEINQNDLNDEVEIIEEDKKIEKINIIQDEATPNNYYLINKYGTKCYLSKHSKTIIDKIPNEIFVDDSIECDFTTNIIYVYVFRSVYASNEIKILDINNENGTLTISFKDESGNMFVANASSPYARWIAVKMDKTNSNKVEFIKK